MCGDIDEEALFEEEVVGQLLALAGRLGGAPPDIPAGGTRSLSGDGASEYMQELFLSTMARTVTDTVSVVEGQRADAIANQAIVLARLAGFLAGQFPAETGLLRTVMEAMLDGHAEPSRMRQQEEAHGHHGHHHDDHHHHQ